MSPSVEVTVSDYPEAANIDVDSGTAFVIGLSEKGPLTPVLVNEGINQFVNDLGNRQTDSPVYDWIDTFFREGGSRVYFSRVVGPNPVYGFLNLMDGAGTPAVSLVVTAFGPGTWSANYKIQVVLGGVGGTYRVRVLDVNNNILEESDDLYDQNSAVIWAQNSSYVRIALGVSALIPAVVAATALSAGTDDRINVTDSNYQAALDKFVDNYGPGQVVAPGRTTDVGHSQLLTHAADHNRVAVIDPPNTFTKATLTGSASAAGGAGEKRFAGTWAPWVVVPGISSASGTRRTVPSSALVCGLIARNEPVYGPNRPAAGLIGQSRYVIDLSQSDWSEPDMDDLNNSGVNVIRRMVSGIQIFGWRSLVNPSSDVGWIGFNNSRMIMVLKAEFTEAGNQFQFDEIDGLEGKTIGAFKSVLTGICQRHWQAGELFGDTAEEAFSVSMAGNTLTTVQNLELHAQANVKLSTFAEKISISIVKRQLTEVI